MLRFIDSFDHYDTDHIENKYDTVNGSPTIISGGRNSTNRLYLPDEASVMKSYDYLSTWYTGFAFKYSGSSTNDDPFLMILFDIISFLIFKMAPGTDHKIHVYKGGSRLGDSDARTLLEPDTWYFLEFKIVADATSGYIEIKCNGETIFTYTGDTSGGATDYFVVSYMGMTSGNYIEDLYILDSTGSTNNDFLGDCRVECVFPNANGTTNSWTASSGNNYECVDETVMDDDSTYVKATAADQIDLYSYGDLSEATGIVYGVQPIVYAKKIDSDAHTNAIVARTHSTNYVGSANTLTSDYEIFSKIYETNPYTSSQWSIAEVNAAEFGVKAVS